MDDYVVELEALVGARGMRTVVNENQMHISVHNRKCRVTVDCVDYGPNCTMEVKYYTVEGVRKRTIVIRDHDLHELFWLAKNEA